jgi:hypothetical protein
MTQSATTQTGATAIAPRGDTTVRRNRKVIPFDARRFRSELAMQRMTSGDFARVCGMSPWGVSRIWHEITRPGELSVIKMSRALIRLGIDPATIFPGNEDDEE